MHSIAVDLIQPDICHFLHTGLICGSKGVAPTICKITQECNEMHGSGYMCTTYTVRTVQFSVSVFRFVHLGKLRLSGPGAPVARTLLHTPATHRWPSNKNLQRTIPQNGKLTQLGYGFFICHFRWIKLKVDLDNLSRCSRGKEIRWWWKNYYSGERGLGRKIRGG